MTDKTPSVTDAPPPATVVAFAMPLPRGVNCCRCRYELAGLLSSGDCPECAAPIAESLRSDALIFAPPEYLSRLRVGAEMATWGGFGWVAVSALGWAVVLLLRTAILEQVATAMVLVVHGAAASVMIAGVWKLTTDAGRLAGSNAQWVAPVARWLLIGSLAVLELALWIGLFAGSDMGLVLFLAVIACALGWGLLLRVVSDIYWRGRLRGLASGARTASVLLFMCALAGMAIVVAPSLAPMLTGNALMLVMAVTIGLLPVLGLVFFAATLILSFIVMVELGSWIAKARSRSEAIRAAGVLDLARPG